MKGKGLDIIVKENPRDRMARRLEKSEVPWIYEILTNNCIRLALKDKGSNSIIYIEAEIKSMLTSNIMGRILQ